MLDDELAVEFPYRLEASQVVTSQRSTSVAYMATMSSSKPSP